MKNLILVQAPDPTHPHPNARGEDGEGSTIVAAFVGDGEKAQTTLDAYRQTPNPSREGLEEWMLAHGYSVAGVDGTEPAIDVYWDDYRGA